MKSIFSICLILLMIFALNINSFSKDNKLPGGTVVSISEQERPKIASWFCELGIGYANITYQPKAVQDVWDENINNSDTHTPMGINLAFFSTINDKTLFGGGLYGTADQLKVNNESLQINTYLLGLIGEYYLTNYVSKGLFLKGGVGIGFGVITYKQGVQEISNSFKAGLAGLIGFGFAIPINEGHVAFSPSFEVYFNNAHVDKDKYETDVYSGMYSFNIMFNFLI